MRPPQWGHANYKCAYQHEAMTCHQGWAPGSPVQPELEVRKIRAVVSGSTGEFPGGSGRKTPFFSGSGFSWLNRRIWGRFRRLVRFSPVLVGTGCPSLHVMAAIPNLFIAVFLRCRSNIIFLLQIDYELSYYKRGS